MIFLFSDYGYEGPYLGQVMTALQVQAPRIPVVHLMADAPRNNFRASAYLLASLMHHLPEDAVVFAVVDPHVGTGQDRPVAVRAGQRWFVGADNGLFDLVLRRTSDHECLEIDWQEATSASFHGRDIYAPVCALIASGKRFPSRKVHWQDERHWPDDLHEVIYVDHFGNAMTGVRASQAGAGTAFRIGKQLIEHAPTFAAVQPGQAFWYSNSNGLIEIAVNQGNAALQLGLDIGSPIIMTRK